MADVPMPPIRIGYDYSVELDFPAGFLQAGEAVRTRLMRFVGDVPIIPIDSRDGDTIVWELSQLQTADMAPGTYYAEAEIYESADPTAKGIILVDNRYVIGCDYTV